jgi:UDP-N-acetylglucosamine 2-epimerase (non-hydrolysing)
MKIAHVVGARPNFMKVAPTMAALEGRPGVEQILIHTGQHYDDALSGALFKDLALPEPDVFLGVGSGSHAEQTAKIMLAIEPVLLREDPDAVLVPGDANSTMAGAIAASKVQLPVIHLEAGLRSGDRSMPEEINRIVADHVADLLLTPSRDADANLVAEGIDTENIRLVGNTMIDSLRRCEARARRLNVAKSEFDLDDYVLVTLHRPALVDDQQALSETFEVLDEIAAERPVIFPVHPRTRNNLQRISRKPQKVRVLEPQSYLRFLSLQIHAFAVVTDSGGVQEETTILGVPCFTLRLTTERPITVAEGTNRVLGTGREALRALRAALREPLERAPSTPDGWDGCAAERAADAIAERYGRAISICAAAG